MNKFYITILLFICFLTSNAQEIKVIQDFRLRSSVTVEKKFFNELTIRGEGAFELEKDMSQFGKYYLETGATYNFFNFLEANLDYRHIWNRKSFSNEFKQANRYALHLQASKKIDRLKLYYRVRYQTLDDDFQLFELNEPAKNILRNRIKLKYNLKGTRLSPKISSELYLHVNDDFNPLKIKTLIGGEYALKKLGEISVYYKNERELRSTVPYTFSSIDVNFKIIL